MAEDPTRSRLLAAMTGYAPEVLGQMDPWQRPRGQGQNPGSNRRAPKALPAAPRLSPVAEVKARQAQAQAAREARIVQALRGSSVLGSTQGLIPIAKLPERYRALKGPAGELPYGLSAKSLDPEDLIYLGFPREEAMKIGKVTVPKP